MSYAVVRVQKFTAGSVKGIEIHDRREKENISHTNKDIDWQRSKFNYDLHDDQNDNFSRAIKKRIDSLNLPKAVRKDAIVMAQVLVTSDSAFFDHLGYVEHMRRQNEIESVAIGLNDPTPYEYVDTDYKTDCIQQGTIRFFQDSYEFLAYRYGQENIISATVHMDERTPHMHFNFVPVTEDDRLSAKSVFTRENLREQQTAFHNTVGQFHDLQRGEPKESNKRRKHLETHEYKEAVAMEQEARQKAAAYVRTEQEAKTRIELLKSEENALEGKIEGLQTQYIKQAEELNIIRAAVQKESEDGVSAFGMESMQKQIAAARQEANQKNRLSLLEKFIEHPQIKPLWEKFVQMMNRGRNRNSDERDR